MPQRTLSSPKKLSKPMHGQVVGMLKEERKASEVRAKRRESRSVDREILESG